MFGIDGNIIAAIALPRVFDTVAGWASHAYNAAEKWAFSGDKPGKDAIPPNKIDDPRLPHQPIQFPVELPSKNNAANNLPAYTPNSWQNQQLAHMVHVRAVPMDALGAYPYYANQVGQAQDNTSLIPIRTSASSQIPIITTRRVAPRGSAASKSELLSTAAQVRRIQTGIIDKSMYRVGPKNKKKKR